MSQLSTASCSALDNRATNAPLTHDKMVEHRNIQGTNSINVEHERLEQYTTLNNMSIIARGLNVGGKFKVMQGLDIYQLEKHKSKGWGPTDGGYNWVNL